MGHRVRGMFASPGRSRGACALHPLWQQKDCQRRLWWVSHAHAPLCALRHTVFVLHTVVFCSICSKIKVWDLQAALDPRAPASTLCLRTLVVRGCCFSCIYLGCPVSRTLGYPGSSCITPGLLSPPPLQEHSGRVFRLQFDEFQIISSSHDDTILIWDFLNVSTNGQPEGRSPSRTYTYITR